MAPPVAGINGGYSSDAATARVLDITSESSAINRVRGCDQGGCTGIGVHQRRVSRDRRFNHPVYTSSIINIK